MTALARFWHEHVLHHGPAWVEWPKRYSREWGVVVECECGKRWLSRAPWDVPGG
ncbi:hypothetical protein PBI_NEBKISS_137 [Mycobacterium phage Nebkiss]|nr:hypothetical protein PBI_NEBKISS_137 [Mycobacterium phage Nebkiss]